MPNVFEQNAKNNKPVSPVQENNSLQHDALTSDGLKVLFEDAQVIGSLKNAMLAHAADMPGLRRAFEPTSGFLSHGVVGQAMEEGGTVPQFPDMVYPEYHDIYKTPYLYNRRTEWVATTLNGARKSPFSRIRTRITDITGELARARGYMKGEFKEEQVIAMMERETTPYTMYIKQRMHRDDLLDITDFDMVALLRNELDIKYDEERARAMLLGDGRTATDPDKIKEANIRPIIKEDPFFTIRDEFETIDDIVDGMMVAKEEYRGGGNLTCYMSYKNMCKLLTKRDSLNHRLYKNVTELCSEMGVNKIVNCPYFDDDTVLAVDLDDYVLGASKGMNKAFMEDFDIDYNQYVYLLEGRFCGALVVPKSAIILTKAEDDD